MIKSICDGYVTFEWYDGETHCMTIDEYNRFIKKNGDNNDMFVCKCKNCGQYFQSSIENFKCCPTCY